MEDSFIAYFKFSEKLTYHTHLYTLYLYVSVNKKY